MLTKIKKFFKGMSEEKILMEKGENTKSVITEKTINGNQDAISENTKIEDAISENAKVQVEVKIDNPDSEEKKENTIEEVKEEVKKVLKTCYDPEIPVDVWELGLIYDIKVATNNDVMIVMTLTSPSCPVAGILPGEIEQKVKDHPMVNDCKVQLTFDPPWSQTMMSEVAKLELGFL